MTTMSIKDEFNKMKQTTTDPFESLTETTYEPYKNIFGQQRYKSTEDKPGYYKDVTPRPEPVAPAPAAPVAPVSIMDAYNEASPEERTKFIRILIKSSMANDKKAFLNLLAMNGVPVRVTESVMMPQEDVVPPAPVGHDEDMSQEDEPLTMEDKLKELKAEIEAQKGSGSPEQEKAWDDITSAFDLILHHLDDIQEN